VGAVSAAARYVGGLVGGAVMWLGLLACATVHAPFDTQRAALATLDTAPFPPDWAPQAVVVVSDPLLNRLATRAAAEYSSSVVSDLTLTPPIGPSIKASPKLGSSDIHIVQVPSCPTCLGVNFGWNGSVAISALGLSTDLGWKTRVGGMVTVEGVPTDAGLEVRATAVDRDKWTVNLNVDKSLPPYDTLLTRLASNRVLASIQGPGPLDKPISLATVPRDGLVRLRGVRARPDKAIAVDLGFSTLSFGNVVAVPDPGDGFAVRFPAKTLFGVAQAAALRSGPQDGYYAEPTSLHLNDGRFEMQIKVWKLGKKGDKWREFMIRGKIEVDAGGQVNFRPDDVDEIARQSWTTPIDALLDPLMLSMLKKATSVTVPGRHVHPFGKGPDLVVEVRRIEADQDVLTIWGGVR
jgi:hypothetical protein